MDITRIISVQVIVSNFGSSSEINFGDIIVRKFGNITMKKFGDVSVKKFDDITIKKVGAITINKFGAIAMKKFGARCYCSDTSSVLVMQLWCNCRDPSSCCHHKTKGSRFG